MLDLIAEYKNHINSDFVMPSDEGVVFFEYQRRPHSIAIISTPNRAYTTCPDECGNKTLGRMILEVLTPSCHSTALPYEIALHSHIHPDTDLISYCSKFFYSELKPLAITNRRDAENWLWNFFELTAIYQTSMPKNYELSVTQEQNWMYRFINSINVGNLDKWWTSYIELYSNVLASRRYLHFKKSK